jgi:hypothetical protein
VRPAILSDKERTMKNAFKNIVVTLAFSMVASCAAAEDTFMCETPEVSATVTTQRGLSTLIIKNSDGEERQRSTGVRSDLELKHIAGDFCTLGHEPSITQESLSRDGSTYTCEGYTGASARLTMRKDGKADVRFGGDYRVLVTGDTLRARVAAERHCQSGVPAQILIDDLKYNF